MAENKLSSSKSLLIFVIVLFALIAALCINIYIYYPALKNYPPVVQPTITPTSNIDISDWKTYRNEEYGFDIKYSQNPEWVVEEAKITNPEAIKPIISLVNFSPKNKVYLLEESRVDPVAIIVSSGSLEDYYKVYPKSNDTIEEKVLINNLSFIRQVDEKWGNASFAVEYPKQNFSFIITSRINVLALGVSEKKLLEDTFNQMLSTFEFIEKNDELVLIPASTDFFTYSKDDQIFSISENEFKVLDKFSVSGLTSLSDECGTNKSEQYFKQLLSNYSNNDDGTEYHFTYKGQTQDSGDWIVTVIPNKIGGFKDDFNICEAGANRYPTLASDKYLLFVSSCGTGADDDSGLPHGCDIVREMVEPTIKLK